MAFTKANSSRKQHSTMAFTKAKGKLRQDENIEMWWMSIKIYMDSDSEVVHGKEDKRK